MNKKKTDIEKYCDCMQEIKYRLTLIRSLLLNQISLGSEGFNVELIFLQLRKILEIIAFSSIVANKDKYEAAYKSFASHWNATYMLKDLERVNPDFYPKPVFIKNVGENGEKNLDFLKQGFITKNEFLKLYEICGRVLHATNPYSTKGTKIDIKYTVNQWLDRIEKLLDFHRAKMIGTTSGWLVVMNYETDGKVHAFPFEALN